MTHRLQEQLSALVDDELPAAEHALLLERLARDAELRECLGRYQLLRDVLNNRVAMPVDDRFVDRVMGAIEAEPTYQAEPPAAWRRLGKPLAGVAVAASVALVAVLALQNADPGAGTPAPQVASVATPSAAPAPAEVWERREPAPVGERLNGYLVQHNEYAASSGVQGVLPYVRIVGYDSGNE